jgi:hypothetical protein
MVDAISMDVSAIADTILKLNQVNLVLMPFSEQTRLAEFLDLVRDNAIPPESVYVGKAIDGELKIKILQKGEAPVPTGNPILDGETITLKYRPPGELKSMTEWARSLPIDPVAGSSPERTRSY